MSTNEQMKVSRRRFLGAAVVAAAATRAGADDGAARASRDERAGQSDGERFEEIVARYGSELGNLRKVT